MKKKLFTIMALVLLPMGLLATTKDECLASPHEVRLLVGDMMFESLLWYDDAHANYNGIGTPYSEYFEKQRTFWTPHLGLEYQYLLTDWVSVGAQLDFQYTGWQKVQYNNQNNEVGRTREGFYNLSILPTARFTYFRKPHAEIYSSIGLGLDINGGTELDIHGKHTAFGVALDMAVLGFAFGDQHWVGSVELGGLSALKNKNTMYMLMSRIVTVGVGYRF